MRLVHYNERGCMTAPPDFAWMGNAVNIFGYFKSMDVPVPRLLERVVFMAPDLDPYRDIWREYGHPYYVSLPECCWVSVGIGGVFHRTCRVCEILTNIKGLREKYGENNFAVAVPVKTLCRHGYVVCSAEKSSF